ncbi:MAG TPA: hypothetical protein VN903_02930 [Polyangia bacterium]|jgi:hypothetical protein|nr:hypothetical protein [Polyangia bacterium]
MMLIKPLFCVLGIAALAAGCGGAGGMRRERILFNTDAGSVTDAGGDAPLPPFMCAGGPPAPLNCAAPVMLNADGHLTDFSMREWTNGTGKWCNESGFHGSVYGYTNSAMFPNDTHTQGVGADGAFHLALMVTGGQYGGGGLAFEGGCMDVSKFTGIKFTAAIASGSQANCPLQLQLPTFDQRPTSQTPPGGCNPDGGSCFNYPTATSLPSLSSDPSNPTQVVLPFNFFSRITTGTLSQIVGLQWQVNATGGACTVEFVLDNIEFIPAVPGADGGSDGGTVDDASAAP